MDDELAGMKEWRLAAEERMRNFVPRAGLVSELSELRAENARLRERLADLLADHSAYANGRRPMSRTPQQRSRAGRSVTLDEIRARRVRRRQRRSWRMIQAEAHHMIENESVFEGLLIRPYKLGPQHPFISGLPQFHRAS